MAKRPDAPNPTRYTLGFGATAFLLTAITLLLVLIVLPRRYMLHGGLREGGLTFPSLAPINRRPVTAPVEQPVRARPIPSGPVQPGPAEIMWETVGPLLENEEYDAAIAVFEEYLTRYPRDRGARRELALTLQKAGRTDEAIQIFQALLREHDDPGVRLLLARALRDEGRIDEASDHYRALVAVGLDEAALRLEWARALAWHRKYDEAAQVLEPALANDPEAVDLRVEMARILHWEGRAVQAEALLDGLDRSALEINGATALHADIKRALAEPAQGPVDDGEPPPPPDALTLTEQAEAAFAAGEYRHAAELLAEAIRRNPTDRVALRAYADLLQYHLEDPEAAREVLLRLEQLDDGSDSALRLRIAKLDVWTGRNEEATERLEALLPDVEWGERAEIHALLGDLHRWAGAATRSPSPTPTSSRDWTSVSKGWGSTERGSGASAPECVTSEAWGSAVSVDRSKGSSSNPRSPAGGDGGPCAPGHIWGSRRSEPDNATCRSGPRCAGPTSRASVRTSATTTARPTPWQSRCRASLPTWSRTACRSD
ncbi:MAG: tetratricopeptide repeat protein [Gemmatimonadota bacterium]